MTKVKELVMTPDKATIFREPEGIMKEFADIYNDGQIIEHIPRKTLRAKLVRLRNQMGVDFYNIDREPENFKNFAGKYMLNNQPITLVDNDGTERTLPWSMGEIDAGLMLGYEQRTEKNEGLIIFKSIVDKILDGEKLTEKEVSHVNTRYCGKVSQRRQKNGKWILSRSFYFGPHGIIYRGIYDFVIQVSNGSIQVKKCRAPLPYKSSECGRLFLPYPGGYEQQFCSKACRMRVYRRKKQKNTATAR